MNRKARVIIFDFDGTLADTLDSIHIAVNSTLRRFGHPEKSRDEVRRAIGNGVLKLIARILPEDRAGDPAYVKEVLDYYNNEYARTFLETDCYPGIQEA
ncbi:MAG TPA: HAD hydrolase-like protein, partial [Bacillota bacterium]|nr:HAD hydrolase-like protein [Bacillota bacterium]